MAQERRKDILVVDDTTANLRLLTRILTDNGYKVRPVPNGRLAIEAIRAVPPDAILLDIRMPGMDGYEVCRILKEDERTSDIPIIFISALQDIQDKIRGFEVGGVDFVTKPFQEQEVVIRLQTHLTIREQKQELRIQYEKLKELETMRETLSHMIVHDINNALQGILGYAQLLEEAFEELPEDEREQYIKSITSSSRTAIEMIRAILDVARMEADQMELNRCGVDLGSVIDEIHQETGSILQYKGLRLVCEMPLDLPSVNADREVLRRIMVNLIHNAVKFSPESAAITIGASRERDVVRLSVADRGIGIPDDYKARIFEKFGQVESRQSGVKYSTGLGLTFCRMAVDAHGGAIGVADNTEGGAVFWFTLPVR